MKRVFIVHGWGASPTNDWFPWLKQQLEQRGFAVSVPEMPETDHPRIESWVHELTMIVGVLDEDTYFVGHSIGCQTILRYLASLPAGTKVGGAVFVAGWFNLIGQSQEELEIAAPWLNEPIDFKKIRDILKKSVAMFSDDDPVVPVADAEQFKKDVGSEIVIEHSKSHFNGSDGWTELPEVLEAVTTLALRKI